MSNIIRINDFTAAELDIYSRLTEHELMHIYEPEDGLFIAESPKVIERALNAGYEPVSFLMEDKHIEGEGKDIIARCPFVPVYTAPFDVLTKLTGYKLTRGMLCAMKRKHPAKAEDICMGAKRIAVLENIMNPTNLGAIFRCAAALGMDAVLLTPGCSDPLYRRAIRVSMGTVFQVAWAFLENNTEPSVSDAGTSTPYDKNDAKAADADNNKSLCTNNTTPAGADISLLKKLGFKTAAFALRNDTINIDDPKLLSEEKLAIVLGTEGDGLADKTITDCDYTVCIPMSHGVDSLNVAAASAIAFWQLQIR
ncbi:MAG: RNA methyltransferase [Lachnospiraceae bacterium]|nr:RNA methyltransferase [Lachnospiraceae bacterium]